MKKLIPLSLLILLFVTLAHAQAPPKAAPQAQAPPAPPTFTQVLDRSLTNVERQFVPAVEAMPEDKYSFAPTSGEYKGVRNFAKQAKHVAAGNFLFASAILGEKPPVELGGEDGPDSIKTKAEIVKFVKDSYAYCHKAFTTLNEGNATGLVQSPFGPNKVTRLGLAIGIVGHGFDHYGQLVQYLRMNGVVPPASRGQ